MDRENFKRVLKHCIIMNIILDIVVIAILSNLSLGSGNNDNWIRATFFMMVLCDILIIAVPSIVFLISSTTAKIAKKKNEVMSKDYCREIKDNYTPAMASFMIDNYIEPKETILATVLDLAVKKYLEIKINEQEVKFDIVNSAIEKLYYHEKYIMNCIKKHEVIDTSSFNDYVIQDCEGEKLVYYKKENTVEKVLDNIIIAFLTIFFVGFGIIKLIKLFSFIMILIGALGTIIGVALYKHIRRYIHTERGKEFAYEVKQLKNFIKDYTLLKERNIEDITLFERYIPYAIALGEADKIENNYIKYNDWKEKYIK